MNSDAETLADDKRADATGDPAAVDPLQPADGETATDDRLFMVVAVGLMALLLVCAVLAFIAYRRPPAGL